MGLLLGGVPGVPPAHVVILGAGVVGTHALQMAVGMGARVTVLDRTSTACASSTWCSATASDRVLHRARHRGAVLAPTW
jgi:alanine dehydrogenase